MKVPFYGHVRQYQSIKAEIDAKINEVLMSGNYVQGPMLKKFEEQLATYAGSKYAIGVGNGTDALWLTFMALGLGPGDELITNANTFFATAEAIWIAGCTAVLVDCDETTRNIDPEVDKVDNVYLYDIDDLQSKVDVNTEGRAREAQKAEEIVSQEVETYLQWERALDAVPTIVDLREKVEDIRKRELEKTLGGLNGINEDQRRAVEAMSQAIVNKLLHAPLVVLKQAASTPGEGDSTIAIARRLFNLDKELKRPGAHERAIETPASEGLKPGSESKCR